MYRLFPVGAQRVRRTVLLSERHRRYVCFALVCLLEVLPTTLVLEITGRLGGIALPPTLYAADSAAEDLRISALHQKGTVSRSCMCAVQLSRFATDV